MRQSSVWFESPTYVRTLGLASEVSREIIRRGGGRSDLSAGFFRRIFIDSRRECWDPDTEFLVDLLRRQTATDIDVRVSLVEDLPLALRLEPIEINILGREFPYTFVANEFTTHIARLENCDEAFDKYREIERISVPAAEYLGQLEKLRPSRSSGG